MRRMMGVLAALLVLLVAGVASAHVSVSPKESTVNGFERYTVRVPTEKDLPTTKVRVELPAGTTFSSVLPVAGWKFDTEKDAAGKVVALVWSGGQINKGEFMEFGISLRNPKEAGPVAFKAYQTYSDGTVVNWTGAADSDTPAPVVKLVTPAPAAAPAADGHDHGTAATAAATPAPAEAPERTVPPAAADHAESSPWAAPGTWLGGGALLVSLLSLVLSLRKR